MLKLAQLINLEVQLIKDSEADPVLVRHRDRAIGQKLTGKNVARPQLFLQWLDHLENPDALLPGKIYTDSLRIVRYILFFSVLQRVYPLGLQCSTSTALSL